MSEAAESASAPGAPADNNISTSSLNAVTCKPTSLERHVTDELEAIISQQAKRATRKGGRRRATSPPQALLKGGTFQITDGAVSSKSCRNLDNDDDSLMEDDSYEDNNSELLVDDSHTSSTSARSPRVRSPVLNAARSSQSPARGSPRTGSSPQTPRTRRTASSPNRSPASARSTGSSRRRPQRPTSHGSNRAAVTSPNRRQLRSPNSSPNSHHRGRPLAIVPQQLNVPKLHDNNDKDNDNDDNEDADQFDDQAPLPGSPQLTLRNSAHDRSSNNNDDHQNVLDDSNSSLDASNSSRNRALTRTTTQGARRHYFKMLDQRSLLSFRNINDQVLANNKPRTYMSRLYVTFQDCLAQLNNNNNNIVESSADYNSKLEAMAILIHECMSSDARNYHSVQHVFDISDDLDDPIAILSAMFHDCIYYSVDGGLSDNQEELLDGCFEEQHETAHGTNTSAPDQPHKTCRAHLHNCCHSNDILCMVETIFGYAEKEDITFQKGLNEFLSAVVAVRQLEPHLTKAQLAKIAACICATIPFKNKRIEGQPTHMDRIFDNMVQANDEFQLGMEQDEVVQAVQVAVQLANNDVGNFGSEDIYYFIDNTWSLLTETNNTLRKTYLFTVHEFQVSLYKMNGFLNFLDPECIFASFRGVPPQEEIDKLTAQAAKNLEQGKKYVGAKLLSASVLSAFAQLTGGDAPLSLFVGDLPSRHHQSKSIDDCLPTHDGPIRIGGGSYDSEEYSDDDDAEEEAGRLGSTSHCDLQVFEILSGGRRSESSFDIKQSPLGAFLYGVVGDRGLAIILKHRILHPMNDENAMALLTCLPFEVTEYLARSIATVALSRAEKIMELVDKIQEEREKQRS